MPTERKPRDSRIQLWSNSPEMEALDKSEKPPEKGEHLQLDLDSMQAGESLVIPFALVHEPSLRVRIARQNGKQVTIGRRVMFCLLKHQNIPEIGAAYEIGCIADKRTPAHIEPWAGGKAKPLSQNVGSYEGGFSSLPESEADNVSRETSEPDSETAKPFVPPMEDEQ